MITSAPTCPAKFKNELITENPYSIYQTKDNMMTGPLLEFVQSLLSLPIFAGGKVPDAFDQIFGTELDKDRVKQIDAQALSKALVRAGNVQASDTVQKQFIDYVAYHPNMFYFTKVKFVAAMYHLIIKFKPEIVNHLVEVMPGMPSYQAGGPLPGYGPPPPLGGGVPVAGFGTPMPPATGNPVAGFGATLPTGAGNPVAGFGTTLPTGAGNPVAGFGTTLHMGGGDPRTNDFEMAKSSILLINQLLT